MYIATKCQAFCDGVSWMTFLSRDHPFLQLLCKLWGFELGDNVHFGYCAPVLIYVVAVGLPMCYVVIVYIHMSGSAQLYVWNFVGLPPIVGGLLI